jgi:hypothetical protein
MRPLLGAAPSFTPLWSLSCGDGENGFPLLVGRLATAELVPRALGVPGSGKFMVCSFLRVNGVEDVRPDLHRSRLLIPLHCA